MKKLISSFFITAALLLAVSVPQYASAEPAERHPEIHQAIRALENAKVHLERAEHDYGGHRREALEACNRAILQLRLALEADKR